MKFGRQFEFYKIPEWYEYYYDYKTIKYVLNLLDIRPKKRKKLKSLLLLKKYFEKKKEMISSYHNDLQRKDHLSSNSSLSSINIEVNQREKLKEIKEFNIKKHRILEAEDLSMLPHEQKLKRFIVIYKSKLKFIDDFFSKKLQEYLEEIRKLDDKMDLMNIIDNPTDNKNIEEALNEENDEMGYAVSWKRALSSLYNETSWLHSYHSINILAIKKMQKKIKKLFKLIGIFDIEEKLNNIDEEFSFFNDANDNLINLRKEIKKVYAKEFTNSDISKASKELEHRLQGTGKMKQTRLIFFYLGVILSCFIFLIFLNNIATEKENDISPFFPTFNFGFIIIESMIGCGLVIQVLKKYRINYVYILEIDLNSRLGPAELYQNGLMLLAIWVFLLLLMKLALNFDFFGGKFALFVLILNGLFVIFLFLPFHIMYYVFRQGIIRVLIRNFFPIGKNTVRFRDFLFGDILTSLNKPFTSLLLGYCLLSCLDCQSNNQRSSNCNRDTIPCFIVLLYPFFIRFTQCLNRLYYTGQKWPHLGNTIKYTGGLLNTIFSWLYSVNKTQEFLILHIIIGILSQGYMLFWDIFVDWGLGRCGKHFFLRDKIVYPKFWYYGAMIIDAILRFSWTWNFIKIDKEYDEWKNLIMAILEAYRRIQWCIFRIENEYWTNPENYRTILAIPELPLD